MRVCKSVSTETTIGQTVCTPSRISKNSIFFLLIRIVRSICVVMPNYRGNRSNRCWDMAIFDFSKWRPSAILDF